MILQLPLYFILHHVPVGFTREKQILRFRYEKPGTLIYEFEINARRGTILSETACWHLLFIFSPFV